MVFASFDSRSAVAFETVMAGNPFGAVTRGSVGEGFPYSLSHGHRSNGIVVVGMIGKNFAWEELIT